MALSYIVALHLCLVVRISAVVDDVAIKAQLQVFDSEILLQGAMNIPFIGNEMYNLLLKHR